MPLRADRLIQRGVDQDTFGRHDHRRVTVDDDPQRRSLDQQKRVEQVSEMVLAAKMLRRVRHKAIGVAE